jgi:hypothetical protein
MGKLPLLMLGSAVALSMAASAYARGGTYHNREPYVVHYGGHKTHSGVPVVVYSAEHHHYHKIIYEPN